MSFPLNACCSTWILAQAAPAPATRVALHTIADAVIAFSYLALAVALIFLVRQRRIVFPSVFVLFGTFLAAGAFLHVFGALTIAPLYPGVGDGLKVLKAAVSLVAAVAFLRAIPGLLQLPTRAELQQLTITLEERVNARTRELVAANERLRNEAAQREQAEAEVRRLNAELQTRLAEVQSLFNLLPVGVAIAGDASCRHIRSNQAFADMVGLPIHRNVSLSAPVPEAPANFRVLHDGRELAPHELPIQRAIATNTAVRDFEETIVRNDGVSIEVIANAVPLRDADGRPNGCVATFQDISSHKQTERKRLDFERKLLQSQKLESIGLLAGGIAHDFNNLLTGVLGHANFARGELARGATNIDPLLAQVETSAQRAAELCRQLLAYAGKGRFVVRLIDLNVAVEQAVPLLKLSMTKKANLELELGTGLPPFRGDPTQVNQVLMNLVANASEAIGTGVGTITLRTERVMLTAMDMLTLTANQEIEPGPFVSLSVRDTGCGIAPETLAHIFEPFFTTKFVGRGLGLAAVLGIVHGHRGGIRVTSQLGAGTTFELFFPVVTPPARNSNSPLPAPPISRGTVLVVDDDETIRSFAGTVLGAAGFSVVSATDGEDALTKLRRDPVHFDAVLLDLTMPKLDGEDTLMALRMLAPNLPVVLTSGYSEQTVAQRFVGRGLADFLAKPFVSEALIASIGSAIARARGSN
jgi:two-component system, cell cycle sensor histidine kinase and response regulator CckA